MCSVQCAMVACNILSMCKNQQISFRSSLFQKACRGVGTASPQSPQAHSSPFRGEFQKQSCGLFLEEGHFGRKCPLLPSKTKVPPPLQGGAIKYALNKLYFLHSLHCTLHIAHCTLMQPLHIELVCVIILLSYK